MTMEYIEMNQRCWLFFESYHHGLFQRKNTSSMISIAFYLDGNNNNEQTVQAFAHQLYMEHGKKWVSHDFLYDSNVTMITLKTQQIKMTICKILGVCTLVTHITSLCLHINKILIIGSRINTFHSHSRWNFLCLKIDCIYLWQPLVHNEKIASATFLMNYYSYLHNFIVSAAKPRKQIE